MFTTFVDIGDIELYCKVYGSNKNEQKEIDRGQATLIFLHGGPGLDHAMHEAYWSKFSKFFQVLLIDQRGNGRSKDDNFNNLNLLQWGKDVYLLCKALNLKIKPIIGGISFGGYVTLSFATQFSDVCSGVIICNAESVVNKERIISSYKDSTAQNPEIQHQVLTAVNSLFKTPNEETVSNYIKICLPYAGYPKNSKEDSKNCITNFTLTAHFFENIFFNFNYTDDLHKIQCPVLILCSDLSPIHRKANSDDMLSNLLNCWVEYHYFPEAGAPVYEFYPDQIYSIINNFIKRWTNEPIKLRKTLRARL